MDLVNKLGYGNTVHHGLWDGVVLWHHLYFKFLTNYNCPPPLSSLFIWYQLAILSSIFVHAARDSEILRLKQQFLDEMAEKNNSTATVSPDLAPEVILENSTPIVPKRKTPPSLSKVKRVQLSENALHSSPAEESQEVSL